MQDGSLNGLSHHNDERVNHENEDKSLNTSALGDSPDSANRELIPSESKENGVPTDSIEGPPSKRRKLAGPDNSRRSTPRPPSPPWKKAGVDGPTSFLQDGKRRSSRVNAIPLELQPPSDKRKTRAAQRSTVNKNLSGNGKVVASSPLSMSVSQSGINGKHTGGNLTTGSPRTATPRGASARRRRISRSPPRQTPSRTRSQSSATSAPNDPTSHNARSKRSHSNVTSTPTIGIDELWNDIGGETDLGDEQGQRVPRLRIKVKKPVIGFQHPSHVIPPRKYNSFREWLESGEGRIEDGAVLTPEAALVEARKRCRVLEATEPGGLLSPEVCSAYLPEQQEEPPQQYSHQDHLVAHALYFKKLLDQEHRRHRNTARLLAQWCADAWRKRNKRPEDILREQQEEVRVKRKQLARDLQKMFDLARAEVDRMRLARWEEERKVEDQRALDRAIKQSTMLFEKRRLEILGETGSDFLDSTDAEESGTDATTSDAEEDESNMSSTDSETEDEDEVDDDEGLTAEELRQKYADLPQSSLVSDRESVASDTSESSDGTRTSHILQNIEDINDSQGETPLEQIELDEVDPMLLDDSEDESTDMDDDMGDSDEDGDADGTDSDDESDDGPGLLGFFSSKDRVLNDAHRFDDEGDDPLAVSNHEGGSGFDDDGQSVSVDEDGDEELEDADEVSLVPNGPSNSVSISQSTAEVSPVTETPDEEPDEQAEVVDTDMAAAAPSEGPAPLEASAPLEDLVAIDKRGDAMGECHRQQCSPLVNNLDEQELRQNGGASSEASPGTLATKPSEPESISSFEAPGEKPPQPSESPAPGLKTPIPHLLRGTLREYQHYGLDWLAGLYNNHINGILADEMGLGKTIQTIALLAHLAVEHEVWGPHLVVVPTSVILNWEMEFKKWCPGFKIMTYYGSIEERRQKRKGWTDDTSWNVLITSYQLVLQDQQVLKRRNWHYMVLDEAHNIKNFRSRKWQTLLTFRTRARLLLTGTPLQNNLTELWSLLFFLMPSDGDGTGIEGFADLRNFSEWFRRPVEQILEHGRETMDDETKRVVTKLHTILRPYILRRLKADVEKQMPAKYEHVVYCRLSKRQRFLYDGFMSMAQTKETLASGNYLSIINCLMQLRKVCNHPDLFETRQISTSFVMHHSVATEYASKEQLVRRRLLYEHPLTKLDLDFLNLVPISREDISRRLADDSTRLMAYGPFNILRERQYKRTNWQMMFDGSTVQSTLEALENDARKRRMAELERCLYFESKRHGRRPVYGTSLVEFLTADSKQKPTLGGRPQTQSLAEWLSNRSSILASMILSIEERSQAMDGYVRRFACVTPAAVASGITEAALTPIETRYLTEKERFPPYDPFHEAQMRLSIAFPDKRLLQYDCGKLQRLISCYGILKPVVTEP